MKTTQRICLIGAMLVALGSSWMAKAVQVTFQVDMSIQQQLGNFTPGIDPVQVAGGWAANNWTPANGVLTQSTTNADVYIGTFDIGGTAGATIQYKFVYGAAGWEEDGVGPAGAQNRQFSLPATPTTLDPVYFNNVDTLPSSRSVTFQVNMSVQIALGNFDPVNDFLDVAGAFNGWAPGVSTLTQSVSDTNVWEGTFTVAGNAGTTAFYKFLIADFSAGADVWENNNVGPGGAQNRELVLDATDQTAPLVYFNNLEAPNSVDVTFQVNMAAQMAYGNFVDGVNQVTAAGEFNGWNAVSFVLTNDPGDPMIYKGTTQVVGGAGSGVAFQYVIDGNLWEEAVGNRNFSLSSESTQELPAVYWNNVDDLGEIATTPLGGDQVEVTWTPGTSVTLQTSSGLPGGWADVEGTTGQSNAVVNLVPPETYFRLIGP